jgi:hypothetical protein
MEWITKPGAVPPGAVLAVSAGLQATLARELSVRPPLFA